MDVARIYFQVKNMLDFISKLDGIKSLTERMDKLERNLKDTKGMLQFC